MTIHERHKRGANVFGRAARGDFLIDDDVRFLNHGSFGAVPRVVLEAQDRWRYLIERQPFDFLSRRFPGELDVDRARLAGFIGAGDGHLAFVENATSAVNAVLRSIDWRPGDGILFLDHTYHAVRMTLDHVADRTGARLVEVALPLPAPDPAAIVEAVADALRPGVRLAVLDHVTSPSALVLPIAELIARCRDNGAMVLVDGAHAPGMLDLDVAAFGADWYAGNCHKWMLAPRGCGFLWARADRAAGIHPTAISHFYNQGFEAEFDWTGTRDVSAWLSVGAAIDYLESHDLAAARRYCHDLVLDRAARVARDLGTAVAGPEAMIGAMAAVRVPTSAPATYDAGIAISDRIWHRHRVEIPVRPVAGALWARLSAQVYNTPEDYDGLAAHIAEAASDRQP